MKESRTGILLGTAAYLCWGFFPLYWPLLDPTSSVEILAHRVVWSLFFCAFLLTVTRKWSAFRAIWTERRLLPILAFASVAVAINWGVFIYGVTNDHVIETSLGYFINPLVTVLLGVFVLRETLRPIQWFAVGVGSLAVIVLTVDYGRLPIIALAVAFSFATYGFLKKKANLGAVEGLTMETAILTPVALIYLIGLQFHGSLTFGHDGPKNVILLMLTGVVTAIPLLLFSGAATRLSLTTVGLLQYLGPIVQFILGLLVFDEDMTSARWIGFVLVWLALVIFTADAVANRRRTLRQSAESVAC